MSTVLVVGSGGREHALTVALVSSPSVKEVLVTPGNAGTHNATPSTANISNIHSSTNNNSCLTSSNINNNPPSNYTNISTNIGDTPRTTNLSVNLKAHGDVVGVCVQRGVGLVVVGPEDPLADGLANTLTAAGIKVFGPSMEAAQIESSKSWAKEFMVRHKVPTAPHHTFTHPNQAKDFIRKGTWSGYVIKASGLAGGKGVVVAGSMAEACDAVDHITAAHGNAATTLVVEERLTGEEVSVLCFTDGQSIAMMPPAQDHKRLQDNDQGPNTGGMGAYAPCNLPSQHSLDVIRDTVLQRTVDGMRKEGIPFVGVLFAGLMLTSEGPKVLEFNCRFGDPETQVLLPLLTSDLYQIMMSCVEGRLGDTEVRFDTSKSCVGVCVVSGGYPGSYPKGKVIKGVSEVSSSPNTRVYYAGTKISDGSFVTSGGRVLVVCVTSHSLVAAAAQVTQAAGRIQFDGAFYRKDIAAKAIARQAVQHGYITYKSSGVDISAGDSFVAAIKSVASATHQPGVMGSLGSFGGLFDLRKAGYQDPILVSGTDGVGTKLKIAQACSDHSSIGQDLVGMCVNDVLVHGARPLFFLDYLAVGHLDVDVARQIVEGVALGCQLAGCALIGGETAEMPGLYKPGEYDLAGFTVGAVERSNLLPNTTTSITPGDALIGLASSGLHSNGFSLVRKIMEADGLKNSDPAPFCPGKSFGTELLTPTRIYPKLVLSAFESGLVKAAVHITGGGLVENIPRTLPQNVRAVLHTKHWNIQPVFYWIAAHGVSSSEMARTFNCGLGMVLVVAAENVPCVTALIGDTEAPMVGVLKERVGDEPQVVVEGLEEELSTGAAKYLPLCPSVASPRKRVAVLISGSGTNLQALLDHTGSGMSCADIVLVVSNVPGVMGLQRAQAAGVPTKVIPHKNYKTRDEFESAINNELESADIELICLAGFMRILTPSFVMRWKGQLLNVHPSLLPSFKGMHAQRQALQAGVTLTGCSVHFVSEEVDCGAIITQEAVPVLQDDSEDDLAQRIKTAEHKAFPRALELVARGKVVLGDDGCCIRT